MESKSQTKADTFAERINETVKSGFISLGLALGQKLRLFKVMCQFEEPATSQQIADAANCKERYIREWLYMMTSADVVDMTQSGEERFSLPLDHRPGLGIQNDDSMIKISWAVPTMGLTFGQVLDAFKKDGPRGVRMQEAHVLLDHWAEEAQRPQEHAEAFLTNVPGLTETLQSGADWLDIGGGKGKLALTMAQKFPASTFINCDHSVGAQEQGRKSAMQLGLTNIEFEIQDAHALPESWTGRFSHVVMVDTLHDVAFPVKATQNIFQVLKPGGYFSVLDSCIDSDPRVATKQWDSPVQFGYSLFHCMSLSLAVEGSAGLGAAAGFQKLTEIMREGGFVVERKADTSDYCHLLGRKPE